MDKAGHLMYASHMSYTNDARLGADECDLLVDLVRQREKRGLYGAKITGGGSGGTVAVLCEQTEKADAAIAQIMAEYQKKTAPEYKDTWVTIAGQLQSFCQEYVRTHGADRDRLNTRLKQRLGLPRCYPTQNCHPPAGPGHPRSWFRGWPGQARP